VLAVARLWHGRTKAGVEVKPERETGAPVLRHSSQRSSTARVLQRSQLLTDELQRFILFREAIRVELREDDLVVEAQLETPAVAWFQSNLREIVIIRRDYGSYQTGSSLAVASRGAVFENKLVHHGSSFEGRVLESTGRSLVRYIW
jgi:hypothetical protein